jgi:hypothetical protein
MNRRFYGYRRGAVRVVRVVRVANVAGAKGISASCQGLHARERGAVHTQISAHVVDTM